MHHTRARWTPPAIATHLTVAMDRRVVLAGMATLATISLLRPAKAEATADDLSLEMILNDPAAPVGGNPDGDVTIVAFFDYNCPFCKDATDPLAAAVKADGNTRLVYKDWPMLALSSVYGAKMAVAAKYQDRYEVAHNALMGIAGRRVEQEVMRAALAAADLDMERLEADAAKHDAEITTLLKRNHAQADGMELPGTPVFLIGPYMVAAVLDEAGYRQVIADAREAG